MASESFMPCPLVGGAAVSDASYDGVVLVAHSHKELASHKQTSGLSEIVSDYLELNGGAKSACAISLIPVPKTVIPSGRLILASTGPVTRDYDDVRRFQDAAKNAMKFATKAGLKSPLFVTIPHPNYPNAELVSLLGALHSLHVPRNVRLEDNKVKATKVGVLGLKSDVTQLIKLANALESGCNVARDVGDGDPQAMAPPKVADFVQSAFAGGSVKVSVIDDYSVISREYPLMAAVNRAANGVRGHEARLIKLEYVPEGPVEETLMLVGKGVTIDTGGTDVKIGGFMFGMSRDKYGSAAVAGFFKILDVLKPKGLKCVGFMCMVRNSIGSNAYTCDEIITSRSGKRIRIYNTDAEGRLTMLDPLTHMREMSANETNPHIMTLATLTGHAYLAMGYYAAVMDNGPAKQEKNCYRIQESAHSYGQPVEISNFRPEDFAFHLGQSEAEDLRQGNTKPSTQTLRGHQSPAAFLQMGSRIDEHGSDSAHPLKYTHVDLGSSEGTFPGVSNGSPIIALASKFVIPRL